MNKVFNKLLSSLLTIGLLLGGMNVSSPLAQAETEDINRVTVDQPQRVIVRVNPKHIEYKIQQAGKGSASIQTYVSGVPIEKAIGVIRRYLDDKVGFNQAKSVSVTGVYTGVMVGFAVTALTPEALKKINALNGATFNPVTSAESKPPFFIVDPDVLMMVEPDVMMVKKSDEKRLMHNHEEMLIPYVPIARDWVNGSGWVLTSTFASATGKDVKVFIIDTGVRPSSPESFNQPVILGFGGSDCHGHGTAMAETIAGEIGGIAPNANIVSVNVMPNCSKYTSASNVIDGIDWITRYVLNNNLQGKAIVNMSIAGRADGNALSDAILASLSRTSNGIIYVAGAANGGGQDACNYSPVNTAGVVSVGAIDPATNAPARYSNSGACVRYHVIGSNNVTSFANPAVTRTMVGTSVATAVMSGILARYLQLQSREFPIYSSPEALVKNLDSIFKTQPTKPTTETPDDKPYGIRTDNPGSSARPGCVDETTRPLKLVSKLEQEIEEDRQGIDEVDNDFISAPPPPPHGL